MTDKYNTLYDVFNSRYPDVQLRWSYKTNYLNNICKIFHDLGSIAEVVSEFEYQKTRTLGVLKELYQSISTIIPTAADYAEAITNVIYDLNKSENLPKLYLETGRYLIYEAGVNILYTSTWYNFNLELDKYYDGINEPSILNGPLINIDIIEENIMLPPLDRNNVLTISLVDAYNYTQAMQFIRYKPAVVLIADNEKVQVIKDINDLSTMHYKEN